MNTPLESVTAMATGKRTRTDVANPARALLQQGLMATLMNEHTASQGMQRNYARAVVFRPMNGIAALRTNLRIQREPVLPGATSENQRLFQQRRLRKAHTDEGVGADG